MKNWIYIFCLAFLVFGCEKSEEIKPKIKIIGHGGIGFQSASNVIPHNSMESIEKALLAYNIYGVEVDVQMSENGTFWMYHDEELWSMTNCESCVSERSDNYLKNCKYRNDFAINIAAQHHLSKLEELFQFHQNKNLNSIILLDVRTNSKCISDYPKSEDYKNLMAKNLNDLIEKYNLKKKVWIGTSDLDFLDKMFKINNSLLFFIEGKADDEIINYANSKEYFKGFILKNSETKKEDIENLSNLGYKSILFMVKVSSGHQEAIAKNPDYLMTDNVQLSLNALK
jgi:glycerophosphoryl diester phosphodiesterase